MELTATVALSSAVLEHPALWEIHVEIRNDGDEPRRLVTATLLGRDGGEQIAAESAALEERLKEWRLACPKGPLKLVFPNGVGKVESHANIANRGWYPLQIEAGIVGSDGSAKYGIHAMRHFFASWAIEQRFSPKRVQSLLGHSSIQMTFDVYGHLFPSLEDDHAKFAAGELELVG